MAHTPIVLTSFGGVALQAAGGEYTSKVKDPLRLVSNTRSITTAGRTGRGPQYTGTKFSERTIEVFHAITGTGSTHETNLHLLRKDHYRNRHDARTLIYVDSDGVSKQVTVKVVGMAAVSRDIKEGGVWGTWLLLDNIALSSSAGSVAEAAKTTSPATVSVANAGDEDSPEAIIVLNPTAAKAAAGGQRFAYSITPVNRNPWPVVNWPLCITDDYGGSVGWAHDAEVTATRSQADGDDVEVYVNDRRVSRWADAFNGAATQLWINATFPPARFWTYNGTATLGAADVTMTAKESLQAMPPLPFYAAFVESSAQQDVVRVTAYDAETQTLTIVRGVRQRTGATHVSGSLLYYCPVLIDLVYGGTSIASPIYIDNDYKPMCTLTSNNASLVFTDFQQTTAAADTQDRYPRTASWRTRDTLDRSREKKTGEGDRYMRYIPRTASLSTDAATCSVMCLAYRSAGALAGHPLSSEWYFTSPIGITTVAFTQVTSSLEFASNEAKLRLVVTGDDGAEEIVDEYDDDASTAETETPAANAYSVAFRIYPFDPKLDSATVELLAGEPVAADGFTIDAVTLTLDTAEEVLIIMGESRRDIYQFGRPDAPLTIANSDGDTLEIPGLVVTLADTLDVDVTNENLTIDDGTSHAHVVAGTWPWLPPGTNNLTITETGIGTVDMGVSSFRSAWQI